MTLQRRSSARGLMRSSMDHLMNHAASNRTCPEFLCVQAWKVHDIPTANNWTVENHVGIETSSSRSNKGEIGPHGR
jgi:hypothetical protein